MAVSPNNTLGKYRILREIARSNDIVYEAIDPSMRRRVAIKELQLPSNLSGTQKRERLERFYREAKAAGTLTHPNIVTIHEVGQEGDRHFIAMEYLEGQSLRDRLQMQGALPTQETVEIILQLCDALGYAHAHGVIHRDVKPDNIHILPNGTVKLTDFGIARITAEPSITSQGQVFGTPSYMSPEQVASRQVDHRTDIFSLGITLYEMLTGRKPFTGDSVITITYNIMNVQPMMPSGIPTHLNGILQKVLAKDASQRYQNVGDLAADLRSGKLIMGSLSAAPMPPISGLPLQTYTQPHTMDTGMVPPEISGIPLNLNPMPTEASIYPSGVSPRPSISPQMRSTINLILSVIALAGLLLLIIWGISMAFHASQNRSQSQKAAELNARAEQAYKSGDYSSAAQSYNAARDAAPGTDQANQAQTGLSNIQAAQGEHAAKSNDPAAAAASYEQALALDNKNAMAYNDRGNLRQQQGDIQGALQDWESAISAAPTSYYASQARTSASQAYLSLAQQAQAASNLVDARRFWQKIIEINPGSDAANTAQQNINNSQGASLNNGASGNNP